jgi:signal transduction histidine kinase
MSLLVDDRFAALTHGDHVCAVYSDPAEQADAMVRYIRSGLDSGEQSIYISDDRSGDEVRARLIDHGVDVGAASASRRLLLLTKRESYLHDGAFCPVQMIAFLRSAEQRALDQGCTGLRVTGEMTWALGPEVGCDRVIEYERALNEFFPGSRSHAICQYNRTRFGAEIIRDVLRTHPIAIVGQEVCPNPFYEPPHLEEADRREPDVRIDWMIEQLLRFRRAELTLQEAVAARDEFLSIASHELRTPLNALSLAVATLAGQVGTAELARITRQVQRLNHLVDVTFDVSRLQDRQRRLVLALCDLQAVTNEVADRFSFEAAQAASPLRVQVHPIIGCWDRQALDRILSNLVSNAIKFGAGYPIDIEAAMTDGRAVIRVRDRGIGVPPEQRQRIFERFARAVTSRSYSGFGLGLWIVRETARAMGGDVRVEDAEGGGTVFDVVLPIGDGDDPRH